MTTIDTTRTLGAQLLDLLGTTSPASPTTAGALAEAIGLSQSEVCNLLRRHAEAAKGAWAYVHRSPGRTTGRHYQWWFDGASKRKPGPIGPERPAVTVRPEGIITLPDGRQLAPYGDLFIVGHDLKVVAL